MKKKLNVILAFAVLTGALCFSILPATAFGQLDRIGKGRAKNMLSRVTKDLKKYYYDKNLHGVDLDARTEQAKDRIDKAKTLGEAFGIIAQVLLDLDDAHTVFYPPARAVKFEYGWKLGAVGDKCFVIAVKPGSDADKKGLRTGDEVISLLGIKPTRSELWKMMYYFYAINPQSRFKMVVRTPKGETKEVVSDTQIKKLPRILNLENAVDWNDYYRSITQEDESESHRFVSANDIVVWKMRTFAFDPDQVNSIFDSRIKGNSNLILDLRGNGGGYVKTLEAVAANLFPENMKIADVKERKDSDVMESDSRGSDAFKGKLVVIVDHDSASASEILARFIQLKERGVVIGDRTAGFVMQARSIVNTMGVNTQIAYGESISDAEVILPDGKSIEKVGVIPDIPVLPTAEDLGYERDPALAAAFKYLGVEVTSADAGKLFPIDWQDGKKGTASYKSRK